MKLPSLARGLFVIIFLSVFGIGLYFVFFSNSTINNKALGDKTFSPDNIVVSQQTKQTQVLPPKDQKFDSYQSRQQIQSLWESFTQPTELELSYYSRGPGMAMVDLNRLRNTVNPDSRQLYLGVKIAENCDLIRSYGSYLVNPQNYFESSLYSLQIYCGDQFLSHRQYKDFSAQYLQRLSEKKGFEYYFGGLVNRGNNPSFDQYKNETELFISQLPTQVIKDPIDLLLVTAAPVLFQDKEDVEAIGQVTKRTMAAMVLAACSSYINCEQSKPLHLVAIASLACTDETTYLPCNHLQNFEQIAQELSGGVPLEDLYSQAEEIVDQIKNHQEKELFNVFAPKP